MAGAGWTSMAASNNKHATMLKSTYHSLILMAIWLGSLWYVVLFPPTGEISQKLWLDSCKIGAAYSGTFGEAAEAHCHKMWLNRT